MRMSTYAPTAYLGLPALITMPRPWNWPAGKTHRVNSPSTYSWTARELEGDTRYGPRSERVEAYEGSIWRFVQQRVGEAFRKRTFRA